MARLDLLIQAWVEYDIPEHLEEEVAAFLKEKGKVTQFELSERFPELNWCIAHSDEHAFDNDLHAALYDSDNGDDIVHVYRHGAVSVNECLQFDDFVVFEFEGRKHVYQVRKHGLIPEPGADIFQALGINPKEFAVTTLNYFNNSIFNTALYSFGDLHGANDLVSAIKDLIKLRKNGNV